MLRAIFGTFAFIAGACAQSNPAASEPVAPSDSVLAVHGSCDDCTVSVGKKQLDVLLGFLFPAGSTSKPQFARSYADVLTLGQAARERGLDQSPEYQALMQWLQEKTLADLLRRQLEKESREVSDGEIEAYYLEQPRRFQEVRLRRLVVPKNNFAAPDAEEFQMHAQQLASALRERAAHGEDLDQLQRECYEALGFIGTPPSTDVGNRRRDAMSPEVSEAVFALNPGEVSLVEQEAYSFVIYKVDAKRELPRQQVRDEIVAEVGKAKLKKALGSITANVRVEWNEKYFGPASAQY